MKTKILSIFLAVTLLFGTLSMSGCLSLFDYVGEGSSETENSAEEKTYSSSELEAIIAELLAKRDEVNLDVHDISINSDEPTSLLGASKALLSVVSIYSTFEIKTLVGYGPYREWLTTEETSAGAGVIFKMSDSDKASGNAYIITNYHVVYNNSATTDNHIASKISCYLYGMETSNKAITAEYVGGSMLYDIAVLKISNSDVLRTSNALEAQFANSDEVTVLETAIAIGNPEANGISATVGRINVDSEYVYMTLADDSTTAQMRLMRIDTAVNGGNSGGGLFNEKGELIGIVNAKMASSSIDNIGYAIPSNVARYIADNIVYYCDGTEAENARRCLLGITLLGEPDSKTYYDTETGKVHILQTVTVDTVSAGSLADGMLAAGDVIKYIEVGGVTYEVNRNFNIVETMLTVRVGDTVKVGILRNGAPQEVSFQITESTLTTIQ